MNETKYTNRIAITYFKEVGRYELPNREEEVRHFTAYAKAKELEILAKNENRTVDVTQFQNEKAVITKKIAEGYLRFVIRQASKRTRNESLLQELIGAGNVGLMEAIPRFSLHHGVRFLTYAAWWINVHMQEHMNKSDAVHIPNHTRKEIRKRKKAEEAAATVGAPIPIRFEEPTVGPLDPSNHVDLSCDTESSLHAYERNMLRHMHEAQLPQRERIILLYYYGLREAKSHTFGDLSQLLYEIDGSYLPSERIRQIKEKALHSLRLYLQVQNISESSDLL